MVALGGCLPSWNYEPEANRKKIEVELAHYRHDVYFSVDSTLITALEEKRLRSFLAALGRGERDSIRVEGHADERAGDLYNLELSARRARHVAAFLRDVGIDGADIHNVALGERAPRSKDSDEPSLRRNRRVEIVVERYLITLPNCPDWSKPLGRDASNTQSSNLGCATQSNLARMIADPRDLVRGRRLGPADGVREAEAVMRYRTDKVKELKQEMGK
jgi:pilus assembly protein CpaD